MLGFGKDKMSSDVAVPSGAGAVIFDAGMDNFEEQVMKASMVTPVIVDFWSPRSAPCKQLMPMLESAVQAMGGKVLLAKVNLDENQQLGQMLRVQSVPTVFAFFQGQPVDAFTGAQSQAQIQAFVEKVLGVARQAQPDAIDIPEVMKAAAEALAAGDLQLAQAAYSQVLQQEAKNVPAYVGLVRTFIAAGQIEQAQQLVDNAPPEMVADAKFKQAKTALDMAQSGGDISGLAAAVEKNSKDHQARLDLSRALFAAGQKEEAIEHALESLKIDPAWNEAAARAQLLQFFDALGAGDPLTMSSRRKFSAILFS